MRPKRIIFSMCLIAALGGCTNEQLDASDSLLEGSRTLRTRLNAIFEDPLGAAGVWGSPNKETMATINAGLNNAKPDRDVQAMYTAAKPTIAKVIGLVACNASREQFEPYTDPDGSSFSSANDFFTDYGGVQDRTGCMKVSRVYNVHKTVLHSNKIARTDRDLQKLNTEAVQFSVDFYSPKLKEPRTGHYTVVQKTGGYWRFRW